MVSNGNARADTWFAAVLGPALRPSPVITELVGLFVDAVVRQREFLSISHRETISYECFIIKGYWILLHAFSALIKMIMYFMCFIF